MNSHAEQAANAPMAARMRAANAATALDTTRAAAQTNLQSITGDPAPRWRTVFTDSEAPTGIAPVCLNESHEEADGSVYDCCREPDFETYSEPLAAYLVALLNADRQAAGGEQ